MVIAAIIANAVLYLWMKTLYNDYLCLVSLREQQICEVKSQHGKMVSPERVRICPKCSNIIIFSLNEDGRCINQSILRNF